MRHLLDAVVDENGAAERMSNGRCPYCRRETDTGGRCLNQDCGLRLAKKEIQPGWECVKCGSVFAPFIAQCFVCEPRRAYEKGVPN